MDIGTTVINLDYDSLSVTWIRNKQPGAEWECGMGRADAISVEAFTVSRCATMVTVPNAIV